MSQQTAIRTTHTGSLVRPPELIAQLRGHGLDPRYDDPAFADVLARSIDEAVRRQIDIGLDVVNDGEYSKFGSWSRYVLDRLDGYSQAPDPTGAQGRSAVAGKDMRDFADFYQEYFKAEHTSPAPGAAWSVTGPVRYVGEAVVRRDIAGLKSALQKAGGKKGFLTAVSPASVQPAAEQKYYATDEEYMFALADALREEYLAIVDAGLTVQLDDAFLASTYDVMVPPASLADYRRWATTRVEAINYSLRGIPEERTRYHVCWGSWNGPHSNDVDIKDIIDLILKIRTGGYVLEMANPRHEHEWRVWEEAKLPDGRILYPGVVSHATNVVEHPDLVAERIVRLAKLVGRERVIATTDCGFAQSPTTKRVHASVMWAKLSSLVEGARRASTELWS